MKRKHLLLCLLALLGSTTLRAYDAVIDGIAYNFSENNAIVTSGDDKYMGEVVIPETVTYEDNTYSVTSIGSQAFSRCSDLYSIIIPNSVTSIGSFAFQNCSGLTSVTIGSGVTSIGNYVFQDCSGLTSVTIGSGVTSIGNRAFYNCNNLVTVILESNALVSKNRSGTSSSLNSIFGNQVQNYVIGETVEAIGNYAFSDCTGMISITIPESVTTVGNYAFSGCSSLTSVTIPNSVTSIGNYAFDGCSGLTSVTIPNSVTTIGGGAFWDCTGLTSATIGNGLTEFGFDIFHNCRNLQTITLNCSQIYIYAEGLTSLSEIIFGKDVTFIDGYFSNLGSVASIKVEEGNATYDSRDNCNAIIETATNTLIVGCKNTVIPNSVTSIGNRAFYNCTGLTSITIPNSVTSIGYDAFYNCTSLSSITIPESVTYIGSGAFDGTAWMNEQPDGVLYVGTVAYGYKGVMPEGTAIDIKDGTTGVRSGAFYGCTGLTSITIPNSVTLIGGGAFQSCI